MNFGQLRNTAPELRVNDWIDADGKPMDKPLRLSDMKDGYKIIYCFQHWCPGCHSRGFPTLRFLHDKLKDKGFDFAVIQTVFEGAETNTRDKLRINQEQYGLKMPFGHDTPPAGTLPDLHGGLPFWRHAVVHRDRSGRERCPRGLPS